MSDKYKKAGVDIQAGNDFVEEIKEINKNNNSGFKNNIGWFAGGFDIGKYSKNMKHPILFAANDGVGTKLLLAIKNQKIENIGQDLVAMSVNDLICHGAKPIFFLDYIGTNKIEKKDFSLIIKNIVDCLSKFNCSLLGGETAELQDLYYPNEYDLCGMAVGIVDKPKIIDPKNIGSNNIIIGINSNGFHSNGYSLVRNMIKNHKLDLNKIYFNKIKLIDYLLKPTYIYVNLIEELTNKIKINAACHITGGGLKENINRVLNNNQKAIIDTNKIIVDDAFTFFQKLENISNDEIFTVFNMGIGFCLIIDPKDTKIALDVIKKHEYKGTIIGKINRGSGVEFIWKK